MLFLNDDFDRYISVNYNLPKYEVTKYRKIIMKTIGDLLADGHTVKIRGHGTYFNHLYKGRKMKQYGFAENDTKVIFIDPHYLPRFIPADKLKEKVRYSEANTIE